MSPQSPPLNNPNDCPEPKVPGDAPPPATPKQTPPQPPILAIEAEPLDTIHVGAGGKLIVPREDIDADLDDGEEIDLVSDQAVKIHKPSRREWIAIFPLLELPVRMLLHKAKPDAIETDHYYVVPLLRGPITEELKDVRVFPYYSFARKAYALLIVNVTPGNSWYESMATLLRKPAEFFAQSAIRIMSDKLHDRYRVLAKAMPCQVAAPTKPTGELLGEALGPDHIITSSGHPIYLELIEGTEIV